MQRVAASPRSEVLDLGTPTGTFIDYLSQFSCVLRFGDLPQALDEDPALSGPEEERDVEAAVERVVAYGNDPRFDVVLAWDLFDYFEESIIRAFVRRLGVYCRTGTLLYLITSNGDLIPDRPGRFAIVDERHVRFERVGTGTRVGMKRSPRGLERIMPDFKLQHSFLLGQDWQDYLFSHV